MSRPEAEIRPALIWCPFPDQETAIRISNSLLDERLIACANMVPGMISLFEWDGEREQAEETGALLKTNSARLQSAIDRLVELHPYDQPAVVAWHCDSAASGTIEWLGALGE